MTVTLGNPLLSLYVAPIKARERQQSLSVLSGGMVVEIGGKGTQIKLLH